MEIQQLLVRWLRAYPGLWLSPLGLGILGSWLWLQPTTPQKSVDHLLESPVSAHLVPEGLVTTTSENLAPFARIAKQEPTALGPAFGDYGPQPKGAIAAASASATSAASTPAKPKTDAELVAEAAKLGSEPPAPATPSTASAKATTKPPAPPAAVSKPTAPAQPQAALPPAPDPQTVVNPAVDQVITMQVAIAEGDTNLSMGTSDGGVVFTPQGQGLLQLGAGSHALSCKGQNLVLDQQQNLPSTVMMAPAGNGVNYVRDRRYRGRIQFFCQGNTVLAVNHIDLQHYLYSVVGSEVSASWPIAALKAQAVAARSYALTYHFRPATEHFHMGDSESYQVYKGIESEDSRVMQAVHETAGEFISYQGGIVESLYAASDEIVMEAFKGGGMSQLGARDLSQQGYNYLQILGYYYPNTSLGRLVLDTDS